MAPRGTRGYTTAAPGPCQRQRTARKRGDEGAWTLLGRSPRHHGRMETLYVTLYPGPRTLVNGLLLEIEKDLLHLRLSGELEQLDTLYATLWLEPEPLNCHLRILESTDDPV